VKRRLLPLPIVFALLLAPLQTASDTVYACSCHGTTVEERVESADVVAIGTVVSLYEDETIDGLGLVDIDGVVSVSTYYKGSGPSEIAVDDPAHGGVCGIIGPESVGREAMLFLNLSDDVYVTGLCHGTQFFSAEGSGRAQIVADIEAVTGPGQAPEDPPPQASPPSEDPESPEEEHTEDTPWAVILPIAFAIPLAVLIVPALLRRGHH